MIGHSRIGSKKKEAIGARGAGHVDEGGRSGGVKWRERLSTSEWIGARMKW